MYPRVSALSGQWIDTKSERPNRSSSGTTSTPLSCISFAAPPALQPAAEHVIVQVRLSAGRALLVACDGTRAAAALTTAVVNVLSAARSGQTHYLSAGLHHAFEPRGLVAEPLVRARVRIRVWVRVRVRVRVTLLS